ncbi:CAMK/CAMKL/CHK1 protein kinase [Sphaeroforma arctica JP610]|uniref:non-specific serine/threonine protein kinase n=1 Tax=Sphaeroforma arctica JP610 TaxID=667725 RepID=A0A0L0FSK0_9EUKA|nr:CAMK/CAMKL/CHK1 protein kinase [Sphaeroforma arctica JP610]KNC79750.1 CAMK/CAMKL/CHK1 protein kinase [Sphaeroforma arctica JP610]|eukprot:XP_014153652.1 CAMK/CAMKL/CHK1 protein kinase [Sphaeroforma arctica JP610]
MMTATPKQVSKPVSKVASNHNQFEGLELFDTLGEGTYAKVKLGITSNGDKYAVKVVNIRHKNLQPSEVVPTAGTPQQIFDMVKKEICIHKNMKHKHIIQFHAYKQIESKIYLLLEYAAGGELFDKIEPDCGVDEDLAHVYFKQLISSVEYLHAMGVAHRDIKPENILLDDHNNFKISDFGLSTVFRNKGKERLLQRRCGTFPYIAPEVYNELEYKAQPADIWSCGVVLITLLAGCLPWDEPSEQCSDFRNWRLGSVNMENQYPWSNMSVSARGMTDIAI